MARIRVEGLRGEEGLLVAVLYRAAEDYHGRSKEQREDAAEFFSSDWYGDILEHLDLPSDFLPEGVGV